MIPRVTRIAPKDYELRKVQDSLSLPLDYLLELPLSDGRLIADVALTSGQANTVNHGLGRTLRGYVVVRKNAQATVWDTAADSKTLTLRTSATATVSLWVF